ncbi:MAG: two pore domain potassium channel family protein, partial [Synechococcaceae bacterium WB7_1B_046]|nr:two pore domain potassium channel family protein [Synechococcaceae bacterium WB7_1B_046]
LNYFAFSCLSTVGFGDIVSTNHPGEMLSVIVAVVGPLYLAVVMGLLIARVTASETSAEVEESLEEMR